ncbi:GGDEF domain-containing protein [Fusibacter paucivorans]|uniref:GGDEF domain-containing protein n=1 Tax=Fusibacter paucivorans TaxID=76009 RepID=A0ABS5PL99_9FIRM|nr:GGDEF domain-containing protein [Fusibacter paucivorans]MBS7525945.1 GGDEF domain-containing protein [Fusibacter paucivorans]
MQDDRVDAAYENGHENMKRKLLSGNYQRVKAISLAICLLQGAIVVSYLLGVDERLRHIKYIGMKSLYIGLVLLLFIFDRLMKDREKNEDHLRHFILIGYVNVIVIWSVISTFFAQTITSDISIYILVVFGLAATVRMRPRASAVVYGLGYAVFFFGMPYFQDKPSYLLSHRMNGLILNVIAFMISWMFYRYSVRDVQQREIILERNRELLYLSQHDGLTGLYNHSTIHLKLQKLVEDSRRRGTVLTVAMLDIDAFKHINDTYGHQYGDQMIKALATELKDFFIPKVSVGRYGGDEFLLIGRNMTAEVLNTQLMTFQQQTTVAFSYGIASFEAHSVIQLIDEADRNMYKCKVEKRLALSREATPSEIFVP